MPWTIRRDSRCPTSKPYGVVLETDGSLEGCHVSRADAREQQAELRIPLNQLEFFDRAGGEPNLLLPGTHNDVSKFIVHK